MGKKPGRWAAASNAVNVKGITNSYTKWRKNVAQSKSKLSLSGRRWPRTHTYTWMCMCVCCIEQKLATAVACQINIQIYSEPQLLYCAANVGAVADRAASAKVWKSFFVVFLLRRLTIDVSIVYRERESVFSCSVLTSQLPAVVQCQLSQRVGVWRQSLALTQA